MKLSEVGSTHKHKICFIFYFAMANIVFLNQSPCNSYQISPSCLFEGLFDPCADETKKFEPESAVRYGIYSFNVNGNDGR